MHTQRKSDNSLRARSRWQLKRRTLGSAKDTYVPMSQLSKRLLKGLALGLWTATGFSVWALFLRANAGTVPFNGLQTTFGAVVAGYYAGGAVGGLLIGLAWPIRRWLLGYAALGILGVFPLYLFAPTSRQSGQFLTTHHLATALLPALFVGAAVGVWAWTEDHPNGPPWLDVLRFPTFRTMVIVWAAALLVALPAILLGPTRSYSWSFHMVILIAGIFVITPLTIAALVTLRFHHNNQEDEPGRRAT